MEPLFLFCVKFYTPDLLKSKKNTPATFSAYKSSGTWQRASSSATTTRPP
ncbi:Uncharacterized protein FKW44_006891 [Caligus rogercresseyi]|uniref:Uncharacterized protein n=1 Tax=Caligus rogercresseyi TaxID=217165 RepID=A0A7T8QT73_CALRO|nr:Uncharacterized protein FKW44_006891 [Caligus rogercresseyi]